MLLQVSLEPVDQILLVAFCFQAASQTLLLQFSQLQNTRNFQLVRPEAHQEHKKNYN